MQSSINSQRLPLTKIQNNAFNVQYSPFRLLNIKYTEASTQRLQEEPISAIHLFQIQNTIQNEICPVKVQKNTKSGKEQIKIISIDLKQQKRKLRSSQKENISNYNKKLKDDILKIDEEISSLI